MKRKQTKLWPEERKDERLTQSRYFVCMQTRHAHHKGNKDIKKEAELQTNKTTMNINQYNCHKMIHIGKNSY